MEGKFDGFEVPESNYYRMPNNWTNISARITTLAELKVVEYVLRHTWGFREYGKAKAITLDEFQHGRKRRNGDRMDQGTGLSRPSVRKGLRDAEEHGYLVVKVDAADKARVKKSYSLRMRPEDDEAGRQESIPQRERTLPPGGKNLAPQGKETLPRSEKDTLKKDTEDSNNSNARARADAAADQSLPNIKEEILREMGLSGAVLAEVAAVAADGPYCARWLLWLQQGDTARFSNPVGFAVSEMRQGHEPPSNGNRQAEGVALGSASDYAPLRDEVPIAEYATILRKRDTLKTL